MRFCFYNPQTVSGVLSVTLLTAPFERDKVVSQTKRMGYLLDILRNNKKYNSAIVVDGTASSLPFGRLGRLFYNYYFLRFFSFFEIYIWCFLNHINPFKQTIIFSLKKLDPQNDLLFGYAYLGRTFFDDEMTERSFFKKFTGKKVLHATHYFGGTKKVADNVRRAGVTTMVAEADLKHVPYFNKYFDFVKKVCVLPFVVRERYVSKTDFMLRKNKCLAMGNLGYFAVGHKHTEEYYDFFKINTLHPMRATIVENREKLASVVDSYISVPEPVAKQGKLSVSTSAEKRYHSFDVVVTYNEYRMLVAPEEAIGLPSINSVEGMACGCAYIGPESPIYEDFGFKKDVHYVTYDGTLGGLVKSIAYWQNHPGELKKVAEAGKKFVLENFTAEVVIERFLKTLETI